MTRWFVVDPIKASRISYGNCVYVIYRDGVPVYVGQTGNLYARLYKHQNTTGLWFRNPGIVVKASFNRRYGEHAMREIRLIAAALRPSMNKAHQLSPYHVANKPWLPDAELPEWDMEAA